MSSNIPEQKDCIVAPASPKGVGAIALIRLSGKDSFRILNRIFQGKDLEKAKSHRIYYGRIMDGAEEIDEVLVSVFKAPRSYTMEDIAEISTHGSPYIVDRVIRLLIENGARFAKAGEFTQRAFLNGRFDLAQAEAVADLIASESEAEHKNAINQMRGGFSQEIKKLREELIHFASLIELELDFSEEDVEFADREKLKALVENIRMVVTELIQSFKFGSVLKEGIPVAIVGKPNAGKSTLMNALLKEEKAIVTEIAGTTRDYIEDHFVLDGIKFRLIDTAGLRDTQDIIEAAGVKRSIEQLEKAKIGIYLFDAMETGPGELEKELKPLHSHCEALFPIGNKSDLGLHSGWTGKEEDILFISAKGQENLKLFTDLLTKAALEGLSGDTSTITNARHYESLLKCQKSLDEVLESLSSQVATDLIAQDIRYALHHLGEITGEITTDDLLENIFSKFCIGK
ncbi:tRNA uridine-5-carboxymethylaminomethyl(34) synthesis GTPase MnmE [Hyphobacterium sp. CCMP332]|nr:tRNA uridine-5-carboxymethylaminomethyl(34) synthesis GTPase MnmE [Hyphobacterium sp. CCMP332]